MLLDKGFLFRRRGVLWHFTFSRLEGCPCAPYHRSGGATLPDFDRAAYVRGFVGSRPSAITALAASILCDDEGLIDREAALKWAVNQRITTGLSSIRRAFIT